MLFGKLHTNRSILTAHVVPLDRCIIAPSKSVPGLGIVGKRLQHTWYNEQGNENPSSSLPYFVSSPDSTDLASDTYRTVSAKSCSILMCCVWRSIRHDPLFYVPALQFVSLFSRVSVMVRMDISRMTSGSPQPFRGVSFQTFSHLCRVPVSDRPLSFFICLSANDTAP